MKIEKLLIIPIAFISVLSCGGDGLDGHGSHPGKGPDPVPSPGRGPLEAVVGEPLPMWAEGYLDIHTINAGRGDCVFIIMPDGTSMCVDAGETVLTSSNPASVPMKPNTGQRPYLTYSKYMKYFLAGTGKSTLDYMLMTHFHADHMGTPGSFAKAVAGYTMTGIMALYNTLPFDKVLDRAFSEDDPEYTFVAASGTASSLSEGVGADWGKFISWAREKKGLQVERFTAGTDKQIVMKRKAADYPEFRIFNYMVNGWYWNGTKLVNAYSGIPAENGNSTGFLLSYGDFEYYNAGDAGTQTNAALPTAKAIGHRIDAMKADHHMSVNCMSEAQMKILQPSVIVTTSFYQRNDQPMISTVDNLVSDNWYSGDKYYCFTNVVPTIEAQCQGYKKAAGINGHYVIRVVPGGSEYYLYHLDDTDNNYRVKAIYGPIKSCKPE